MKEIMDKENDKKEDKEKDLDNKYKIILIGDHNTKKSSLLNIFMNDTFDFDYQPTIGLDFQSKNVNINGKDVHLILYDTAGQEKYRSLMPMYLRDADIIIILYNVAIYESFLNVEKDWIKEINELKKSDTILILVGNQIDLESKKIVDTKDGEALAAKYGILFYEVSIKETKSIYKLFYNIIFPEMAKKFKIGNIENLQKYYDENSLIKKNKEKKENKENEKINLKIIELQNQLNDEKNKNSNLINKINQLEKELDEVKSKNIKLIEKIKELENKSNDIDKKNEIKNLLVDYLLEKDKEIKELKIKLSRYPFELNENEKLISVIFTTLNEEKYYSIICKDTDDFNKIEKKFFEVFPQYYSSDNIYFKVNGKKIDRYKNLIGNNINHNDIIIIYFK